MYGVLLSLNFVLFVEQKKTLCYLYVLLLAFVTGLWSWLESMRHIFELISLLR